MNSLFDIFISYIVKVKCSSCFKPGLENLVEKKHYKLARSHRTGLAERELKPNPETRNRLSSILSSPTTQALTSEEQDLLWRFRYYLAANDKALSKFVKCVNWAVEVEAEQAMELIRKWAPMAVEDSLELLGPNFTYEPLRRYAVHRLSQVPARLGEAVENQRLKFIKERFNVKK